VSKACGWARRAEVAVTRMPTTRPARLRGRGLRAIGVGEARAPNHPETGFRTGRR